MALAHYLASRYDKALEYATLVVQLRPDWWLALMIYAALAATRKIREARSICADLNRVRPDMTIHALAICRLPVRSTVSTWRGPWGRPGYVLNDCAPLGDHFNLSDARAHPPRSRVP